MKVPDLNIKQGGAIGVVILLGLVGYGIYRKMNEDVEGSSTDKATDDVKKGKPRDDTRPQLSQAEIEAIANGQYEAMRDFGTNEDAIWDGIKDLNGADLRRVFSAFGNPKYAGWGGVTWNLWGTPTNLFGWYNAELKDSPSWLAKVKQLWQTRAGMTF